MGLNVAFAASAQVPGVGGTGTFLRGGARNSAWTNRAGEAVSAICSAITNQTVYLVLPTGRTQAWPLRIFPESEQLRMKQALGVAPLPGCLVPAWRLFESQLASARDAEGSRASLGFVVKQVKRQEGERAVSLEESKYWIARAVEQERGVRQALLEKEAQVGLRQKVSAAQQQGKE